MFVGGAAFSVTRIPGKYWATSIIIGAVSLPIGVLIRLVPTGPCIVLGNFVMMVLGGVWSTISKPFRSLAYALHIKKRPVVSQNDEEHAMADKTPDEKISLVRDNLEVLSKLRGGRSRSSSMVQRSRLQTEPFMRLKVSIVFSVLHFGSAKATSIGPRHETLRARCHGDCSWSDLRLHRRWSGESRYAWRNFR